MGIFHVYAQDKSDGWGDELETSSKDLKICSDGVENYRIEKILKSCPFAWRGRWL